MKKFLSCFLLSILVFGLSGCADAQPPTSDSIMSSSVSPADSSAPMKQNTDISISYADSGFTSAPVKATGDFFAMDTVMTLQVYAKDEASAKAAIEAGAADIIRLDHNLSTNRPESEIYRLNKEGKGELDEDGRYLMNRSLSFYKDTDGAFDIAIYPLVKAWGFTTNKFQVPDQATIDKLLPLSHLSELSYNADSGVVEFKKPGMGIDFGGIAKGYASTRLMEIFREHGIESALCSLGGNVQLLNAKPDGEPFKVAIQNPFAPNEDYAGILTATDEAVITSGSYQRYFEQDGKRYHHIIDPATGKPADKGIVGATVVCKDGTMADAYATALFVKGLDEATTFWRAHADEFEMILIMDDNSIYVSEGLRDRFQPIAEQFDTVQVLSRNR